MLMCVKDELCCEVLKGNEVQHWEYASMHVESFAVCARGKMAQELWMVLTYCGVVPILFGCFF